MEQAVDDLNNLPFVTPTPNILYTLSKAKKLGYKIIVYKSSKQNKKSFFRRKLFNSPSESSLFDYLLKANCAQDVIEFAYQNNIDLTQSIFIRSSQNELKDLDLKTFGSIKLLDYAK